MCYIPFPPLWINRTEMVVLTFIFFFSCNIVYNVWGLMNAIAENKSIPLKCKKKKIKKNWNLRNFYQGEINGNNNFFFLREKRGSDLKIKVCTCTSLKFLKFSLFCLLLPVSESTHFCLNILSICISWMAHFQGFCRNCD